MREPLPRLRQTARYAPVYRAHFPGVSVIVGHPRLHLTRMAHNNGNARKTRRAKQGERDELLTSAGSFPRMTHDPGWPADSPRPCPSATPRASSRSRAVRCSTVSPRHASSAGRPATPGPGAKQPAGNGPRTEPGQSAGRRTGQCPARSRGAGASGRGTGQGDPSRSRNRAGTGR